MMPFSKTLLMTIGFNLVFILFLVIPKLKNYFLFCSFLFVLIIFFISNWIWVGDFWTHCEVVRELATHPSNPKHPEFLLNLPSVLFTPYSLIVAWVVRISHLSPVTVLSWFGLFNFCLLVYGLHRFCRYFFNNGNVALYTLFFTLFLWGPGVWFYSGFLHFKVLGFVLPYPSTFTIALIFLCLSTSISFLNTKNLLSYLVLLLLGAVVWITHPLSSIALMMGIMALAIGWRDVNSSISLKHRLIILTTIPLSLILAMFWPYYSILKVMLTEGSLYDVTHLCMYQHVLLITSISLIGIPTLFLRLKKNSRDPLVLMFLLLVGVYAYGWFSGHYSYGRVISFIVLVVHLSLANWIINLEQKKILSLFQRLILGLTIISVLMGLYFNCDKKTRNYLPGLTNTYSKYEFLSKYTKQYEVILSDLETNSFIPTFGGKVIATYHLLPFVKNNIERNTELLHFYSNTINLQQRLEFLKKYKVDYVLINKEEKISENISKEDQNVFGKTVFEDNNFKLIHVNKENLDGN